MALTSIRKMIEIYPVKVIMCAYSDEDYKLFQDVWSGLDHYLTINTKKAADKKSDVKAKSTFVEELTLSEFKMCTNQEFKRSSEGIRSFKGYQDTFMEGCVLCGQTGCRQASGAGEE